MHRRLFLQFPLLASVIATQAQSSKEAQPKKGFKVEGHKDRYEEELLIMGGPAMHIHHQQDEWFYVISGEFIIRKRI